MTWAAESGQGRGGRYVLDGGRAAYGAGWIVTHFLSETFEQPR